MRNIIIGTSGHVDHGKTTLIKKITGIDTNRLPEEKKREMTIDIGFAFLESEKTKISIVDVPGHEKFIKNMTVGTSGVNYLILVIALDDGIMPQTLEHFNIAKLLGIKNGMIVLTKKDLVSKMRIKEVKEQIKKEFSDSFLGNVKILETSKDEEDSYERVKDYLLEHIAKLQNEIKEEKIEKEKFKMYIDRSFLVKGFGTVVTGTSILGELRKDDILTLYPQKVKVKVKGIETHGLKVDKISSGKRCALNISNINFNKVNRGNILTLNLDLDFSDRIDVFMIVLDKQKIKNNQRVKIYIGTKEIIGRISFFEKFSFAQIKLEEKVYLSEEEVGIIRDFSSLNTIGSIKVINVMGEKIKKNNLEYIKKLDDKLKGKKIKKIILNKEKNIYILENELEEKLKEVISFLKSHHKNNNLHDGISTMELKRLFFKKLETFEFNKLLVNIKKLEIFEIEEKNIKLKGHKIKLTKSQKNCKEKIFKIYKEDSFSPRKYSLVMKSFNDENEFKQVHEYMVKQNNLIHLGGENFILRGFLKESEKILINHIKKFEKIELKDFKKLLKIEREMAILILEKLDKLEITKIEGKYRLLKSKEIV